MEILLLSLFVLAAFFRCTVGQDHPGKVAPTNDTTPQFHHRTYHSTIVVGDYLYIDGGEITTWLGIGSSIQTENVLNGTKEGNIFTKANNWTYSIDLSSSWSTATLNPIYKSSPPLNKEALWYDALGKTFYQYNGAVSEIFNYWWDTTPATNQFWQFTPSGDSGEWVPASTSPSTIFQTLHETEQGFYASGNGLGFALGGVEDDATYINYDTEYINTWKRVTGMVMYNDSSQQWYKVSTKDFVSSGFAVNGAAHFVPSFGPEGLLFVLGGATASTAWSDELPISFDYVFMFEPVSQQWRKQRVTGSRPESTENQCVVGVQGDNGTYEIFMYGGQVAKDIERTIDLGAVWVLTLPAFHWERQPDPLRIGRYYHSCQVAGNRQMISTGGFVFTDDIPDDVFDLPFFGGNVDPWDQGIGIFDLSDFEWKSSYDADAEPYVTPEIIKDYYKRNSRYPEWDGPDVKLWFTEQAKVGRSESSANDSGSSNTGAIAGGVVGGLVGSAVIGALMAFVVIRRRRRKRREAKDQYQSQYDIPPEELNGSNGRAELAAKMRFSEHDGTPIHELGSSRGYDP